MEATKANIHPIKGITQAAEQIKLEITIAAALFRWLLTNGWFLSAQMQAIIKPIRVI